MIESSFPDADGVAVHLRTWPAEGSGRGAVVIVHGASEHAGRYGRVAEHLAGLGYTVLAPDLRGHGRTAASTGVGLIGDRGLDGVLDEIDEVVTRAADAAGSGPVVLVGHSMGSLYALRYSELHADKLAGLVLSGPIGVIPGVDDMIAGMTAAVAGGLRDEPLLALSPFNTAFEPARTPFDWLSRDPAEVDAYLADPMCGDQAPLTYGYVLANLEVARDGVLHLPDLGAQCPVLLIGGEADPASGFAAQARELARRLGAEGAQVTERFYPEARHEVLNETNRDEVVADLVEWLQSSTDGKGAR